MKIFISHSWRDKTFAQQIADSLNGVADVWHDLNDLYPGQNIKNTIDAAIQEMDLVFLLWSAESAASQHVRDEIISAIESGIEILPCLLDETPLEPDTDVGGLLGIDCTDRKAGLFRLQIFVMRKQAEGVSGAVSVDTLNELKSFEGAFDYVNNYRNKQGIAGSEEGMYWASKILENLNQSRESLTRDRDRVGDILQFMQVKVAEMEDAQNDKARLRIIKDEIINSEFSETDQAKMMLKVVENLLNS